LLSAAATRCSLSALPFDNFTEKTRCLKKPPASSRSTPREVAELIVSALNLDLEPSEIDSDAPLFGEGLGLDSIDVLEIALVTSKRYGFQLRSDNEDNVRIFLVLAHAGSAHREPANEMTGITPASLLRGLSVSGLLIAWAWLAHDASAGREVPIWRLPWPAHGCSPSSSSCCGAWASHGG
jgi:acyl carrier protein